MDIAEFRTKYPQYDAIGDAELADKLYNKHYASKVERSEFDQKFLGAPVKSDSFLGAEQDDWWITKQAKNITKAGLEAIQGDAEHKDMGSFKDSGALKDVGLIDRAKFVGSELFGSDEDLTNRIKDLYPDAEIKQDANGNTIAELPDGRGGYVNTPGMDSSDIAKGVATGAAFTPAARAASLAGGVGARVLAGSAGAGLTDAGLQKLAGRDEIDGGQVAINAAVGGAGEAIAPLVGGAINKLWNADQAKWRAMSRSKQNQAIKRQLIKDGYKPADLQGMIDGRGFGEARVAGANSISAEAQLAQKEFGFKHSRGQAMPEGTLKQQAAKEAQLNNEELLEQLPNEGGQKLRNFKSDNYAQLDKVINDMVADMSGGVAQGTSRNDSARRVHEGLVRARDKSKQAYDAEYAKADGMNAEVSGLVTIPMASRMIERLQSQGVHVDDMGGEVGKLTKGAFAVLKELQTKPQSGIHRIENQRKMINNMLNDTKISDPMDHRALAIIKREFDESIAEAFDDHLIKGDPEALKVLQESRALYADYSRKFNNPDQVGKLIQKMVEDETDPADVAKMAFGATGLKTGASRFVNRYAKVVGGKDTPEFDALRETYLQTALTSGGADNLGMDAMITRLNKVLRGDGEETVKALYTKDEVAKLHRLERALKTMVKKGDRAKSSGTAERMIRYLAASQASNIPGVRGLIGVLENMANHGALQRATTAPRQLAAPVNASPAAAAAIAVDGDE